MKLKALVIGAAFALLQPITGLAVQTYYNASNGVITYVSEDAYGNIIIQTRDTFTGSMSTKTISPSSPYYQYYIDKYGLSGYGDYDNTYYPPNGGYNAPYEPFTIIPYLFFGDHDRGYHRGWAHHGWDHHGDHDHEHDHDDHSGDHHSGDHHH